MHLENPIPVPRTRFVQTRLGITRVLAIQATLEMVMFALISMNVLVQISVPPLGPLAPTHQAAIVVAAILDIRGMDIHVQTSMNARQEQTTATLMQHAQISLEASFARVILDSREMA